MIDETLGGGGTAPHAQAHVEPHAEAHAEAAVPDGPPIPGLLFRRFRGSEDFAGMVDANMAARREDGVLDTVTVASIANQYEHLANTDLAQDLLIVELNGRIVGYGRVQWTDQTDGSRAYESICLLRPELRGRGIGGAMLDWAETRARAIATSHADERPRWHQTEAFDGDRHGASLLARRGYEPVRRSYEMVRPTLDEIPTVPLPAGLVVRPVGREHMRAIWEADAEAFRDHWGEVEETEESWLAYLNDPIHDPSLYVVAFDGDEIAGHVLNVIDPEHIERVGTAQGLIDSVAVRRPWRRRGLARALMARALDVLRDQGMTSAFLGVDAENPNRALHLYESLGFEVASSATVYRKPLVTGGPNRADDA